MVATPIGNLADLTLRAIHVLVLADAVACEDTRITGRLLRYLGLDKPLLAVHAHNEQAGAAAVLARLAAGQRVAYASDAGTPAISDPGAALVAAVAGHGFTVVPVPGASSAAAAISVAGDDGAARFNFVGFLPTRGKERHDALGQVLACDATQVLFEAPHRIDALLAALAEAAPQRRLTICRELTKQFETVVTLDAGGAPQWLHGDPNRVRGEFVLVLHAQSSAVSTTEVDAAAERVLAALLAELPLKQAVALAAQITGASRNALYERALELKAG
jgi:16S rRNA (cytidine1402-2'-O)-methyltransferase